MWLYLAFLSAFLLGFYDTFKKKSLSGNAVIPVLFLNTLFCSLIFLPLVVLSSKGTTLDGSIFKVAPAGGWEVQKWIILKSMMVLSSWILGYFGMKHLPLTIVGPINATRPVMVLVGAMLIFGERLNILQWIGVLIAILSFFMLERSGKKEGIDFKRNVWVYAVVGAAVMGALCALYDKFLMNPDGLGIDKLVVLSGFPAGNQKHHFNGAGQSYSFPYSFVPPISSISTPSAFQMPWFPSFRWSVAAA